VPLHRQGTGREIADAVAFVASSHAGFITAETVRVDGGWTAYQLF
jgi:3-oxoacyl-[acyl-carrier protein] reductase